MIDIYRKYSNPKIINLKPLKDVYERGTTNGKENITCDVKKPWCSFSY
jgi:hypothetical protein